MSTPHASIVSIPYRGVFISSRNRDSGTQEDFTMVNNGNIFNMVPRQVELIAASIPRTWYNIESTNNQLILNEGGPAILVTVPPGNYSGTTLATALQAAIAAAGPTFVYTVTFNTTTLTYTISATGPFSIDFNTPNSLAAALGYPAGTITPLAVSTTSTQIADLVGNYEIFICSDLVGGIDNGVIPWQSGNAVNNEVLAVVPITVCYGTIQGYRVEEGVPRYPITASKFAKVLSPGDATIPTMRFYLRFPDGTPVDLHGAHWTCTINFTF